MPGTSYGEEPWWNHQWCARWCFKKPAFVDAYWNIRWLMKMVVNETSIILLVLNGGQWNINGWWFVNVGQRFRMRQWFGNDHQQPKSKNHRLIENGWSWWVMVDHDKKCLMVPAGANKNNKKQSATVNTGIHGHVDTQPLKMDWGGKASLLDLATTIHRHPEHLKSRRPHLTYSTLVLPKVENTKKTTSRWGGRSACSYPFGWLGLVAL